MKEHRWAEAHVRASSWPFVGWGRNEALFMGHTAMYARRIIGYLLGGITALLLARLVLRLVAARPDNPIFAVVFAITPPLPVLAALDAGQPRFGAVLEFSTLALIVILLAAGLILRRLWPSQ